MLSNMSSFFVRTLREDPADAEVNSHKLLVRAGYIRRVAPGVYSWLPLGLRVLRQVEQVVREEMNAAGAQEVLFPGLLPREPYEATNRWNEYGPNLFRLADRRGNDYLLAPTHEEMFTLLVKDLYSSYKDLPLTLYQIQTKYRDEARPRAGLIRGREFVMKDAYSFDLTDEGLDESYNAQRRAYQRIFARLGLEVVICAATSGAMGGSRSEEFLHPCEIGEDTFVRSAGGYAANAEAVTTVAPPEQDYSQIPAAHVHKTPGAKTIADLVDLANRDFPRSDRPWEAADTLKHVMVTLVHPDGRREVVGIALPGDREVDLKRVEAAFAPAEVEVSTPEDLAKHPELVAGYIGPQVLGPQSPARAGQPDDAEELAGVRYFLDPRVVTGTAWIAGANEADLHVVNLVKGRDFEADGVIEAAEIKPGDQAPDGSGPLEIARGIEVGHIFQLGRKYAKALGLTVLDENGKSQVVTMGSYGIGVSRVMAALAEQNCDEQGLKWPLSLAPFQVHVLATGKGEEIFETAQNLAKDLAKDFEVLYDDRLKVSAGVKFADSELLGMPFVLVVGRGLKDGKVELRNRRTGEKEELPVEQAAEAVREAIAKAKEEN
ncbi:proline--tRNA ligase [Boudabousia tangfeifanii]|uniref:Proline--tRNA ligase n=1 Tax=Boudabousia tangfeifanii TaxID=1912795 RepID=A0A1D9MKF5_9ACTO|nr:proline--tRNA ligase [Boudabousia tangfeifanii]AOZ72766.1 proline--tRNA ligase [Boudabousia tangfeifanii]